MRAPLYPKVWDWDNLLLAYRKASKGKRGRARLRKLDLADAELDKVRLYLRLASRWTWLSPGQYQHAAGYVTEMGRLLGGWKKLTRQPAAT